jgi:hypothetical protein
MKVIESGVTVSNNKEVVLSERKGLFGEEYVISIDGTDHFTLSKTIYTEEKALERFDEIFLDVFNGRIFG